jgi:phosphocarrier protein HPr
MEKKIRLKSIDDVKDFVNCSMACPDDVTLKLGKYIVDGKSIMGIFSLDLNQPVTLSVDGDSAEEFMSKIQKFICE